MEESYDEGLENHIGPESCTVAGNGRREALTGVRTGCVLSLSAAVKAIVVRYSPDGRTMAVGPGENTGSLSLLDAQSGRETGTWDAFEEKSAEALCYSSDGALLGAMSNDGEICVRGPDGRTRARRKTSRKEAFPYPQLGFGAGDRVLAATVDDVVELWHWDSGTVHRLEGHVGYVRTLAFSPQVDTLIATGGDDRTVRLWDVSRAEVLQEFSGHEWW